MCGGTVRYILKSFTRYFFTWHRGLDGWRVRPPRMHRGEMDLRIFLKEISIFRPLGNRYKMFNQTRVSIPRFCLGYMMNAE
jgi:hypothetical protein